MSQVVGGGTDSLGKELYKRSPLGLKAFVLCGVVGMVFSLLACGVVLAIFLAGHHQFLFVLTMPGMMFAGSLLISLLLMKSATTVVRVHERGVSQTNWFGSGELRYDELDSFSFQAVDQYVYGVYRGTNYRLRFRGTRDGRRLKVELVDAGQRHDEQLSQLRNAVSRAMAPRMASQMAAEGNVRWTKKLTLSREGIGYKRGVIPFSEVSGYEIEEGHFQVVVGGDSQPLIVEPVSADNFFPGLVLFESMLEGDLPAADEPSEVLVAEYSEPSIELPATAASEFDTLGSDVDADAPQDEFAGCRACGQMMVSLLGTATAILFVGGVSLAAWRSIVHHEDWVRIGLLEFFPIVGALLAFVAALFVHRRERRRVAMWRESPQSVESIYGGPPRPGNWIFCKLSVPVVVLLLFAVLPTVFILFEFEFI